MHVQIKQQTVCVNDKCIKQINTVSNKEFSASNKIVGRLTGHKTTAAKTTTTTHTQKANDVWKRREAWRSVCFIWVKFAPVCVCTCVCACVLLCASEDFPFTPSKRQPEFWVINKFVQSSRGKTFLLPLLPSSWGSSCAAAENLCLCVCAVCVCVCPRRRCRCLRRRGCRPFALPSLPPLISCFFLSLQVQNRSRAKLKQLIFLLYQKNT